MATAHNAAVTAASRDDLVRMLADTPHLLESLTRDIDEARLQCKPAEGEWSANDILAHLRACADMWGGSIRAMIERDHPTLRYVSPRTWLRKTSYVEQNFLES